MYVPRHFAGDPALVDEIVATHDFALLVTQGDHGPEATHLPLVLDRSRGGQGVLLGHLARANPHGDAIDGKPGTAWGIYPQVGKPHEAVFEFAEPLDCREETELTLALEQLHGGGHLIGRFRLSLTEAAPPLKVAPARMEVPPPLKLTPVVGSA